MTALARDAERLAAVARRPLQPRRELLTELAARLRAFDAIGRDDHERAGQFQLEDAA